MIRLIGGIIAKAVVKLVMFLLLPFRWLKRG